MKVKVIKAYRGIRSIAALIFNLYSRWRCMVNFTSQLLYPNRRTPVSIE
jgi:hypothetical protein